MAQSYCSHKNVGQHCCIANGGMKEREREVQENLCLDNLFVFRICKYFNFSLMKS